MKEVYRVLPLLFFVFSCTLEAQEQLLDKEVAVQLMLENNFGVRIAKNNVAVAKNNQDILNSGFLPSITGNAGANYQRDDSTFEFPGQFLNDADGNPVIDEETGNPVPRPDASLYKAEAQRYNASLRADYVLFDGLGRFYDYKRLKEEYNLTELQARETIETTMLQLFSVYYEVARISENIQILSETYKSTADRLKRAEYSFEFGQSNKLDVLNAEVDLVNDSINLMNERQLLKNTIRDLNILLNQELENTYKVDTTVTFTDMLIVEDFIEKAEKNNVSMLQAEKNTMINDYTLKASKSVFLPTIGLTGSYGWNLNQNAPGPFFPGVNVNNTRSFGLGATLTWSIFDGGRGITQIKNAKILLESQEILNTQIRQEIKRDIANARGNYFNLFEVYELQGQNVKTATNNYLRSVERYKLGQITSVELRQAQINLLNAKTSKNLAKYNAKLAELQLLQLAGQLLNVDI
ncbi:TolC family protein [Allomuricauda sp. SCSIO 65647]|uniref:TolC family protein n=1 Tax=Allomuricauda sp. SCSIO 65647 TaxID=2908843 RepID=UPI001F2209A7|nr:TolC family protein [Muricauda sp. SCSIO 65647]UJH66346.1 TolC family protein [Muricauda sp. SCSIO 65647]